MLQIKLIYAKTRNVKYCNTVNNIQIGGLIGGLADFVLVHRFGHRDIALFWPFMHSPKNKNHRKHWGFGGLLYFTT